MIFFRREADDEALEGFLTHWKEILVLLSRHSFVIQPNH